MVVRRNIFEKFPNMVEAHLMLKQIRNNALEALGDCEIALDAIGMLTPFLPTENAACYISMLLIICFFVRCSPGLVLCCQLKHFNMNALNVANNKHFYLKSNVRLKGLNVLVWFSTDKEDDEETHKLCMEFDAFKTQSVESMKSMGRYCL